MTDEAMTSSIEPRPVAVDFAKVPHGERGFFARLHRHGHVSPGEIATLLNEVGLQVVGSGAVGFAGMHFVLATAAARSFERGNAVFDPPIGSRCSP